MTPDPSSAPTLFPAPGAANLVHLYAGPLRTLEAALRRLNLPLVLQRGGDGADPGCILVERPGKPDAPCLVVSLDAAGTLAVQGFADDALSAPLICATPEDAVHHITAWLRAPCTAAA